LRDFVVDELNSGEDAVGAKRSRWDALERLESRTVSAEGDGLDVAGGEVDAEVSGEIGGEIGHTEGTVGGVVGSRVDRNGGVGERLCLSGLETSDLASKWVVVDNVEESLVADSVPFELCGTTLENSGGGRVESSVGAWL